MFIGEWMEKRAIRDQLIIATKVTTLQSLSCVQASSLAISSTPYSTRGPMNRSASRSTTAVTMSRACTFQLKTRSRSFARRTSISYTFTSGTGDPGSSNLTLQHRSARADG